MDEASTYETLSEQMAGMRRAFLYRACSRAGLTPTQYFALSKIGELGHACMSPLAHELALSPGGATTLIDRLVRHGLVERKVDEGDRRKVWVTLSPQGREALALTNQYKHQVWREVFMTLSPDERDQVLAGIRIQSEAWRRFTEEARP